MATKSANEPLRRDRVRRLVKKNGWDAFLVSDEVNVGYLTGFTGDSSYLLITPQLDVMVSDSRYTTQLQEECGEISMEIRDSSTTTIELLGRTIGRLKIGSLAVESHRLTKQGYDQLNGLLPQVDLVDSTGVVEDFRAIKDAYEVAEIRRSIDLAQRTFRVIRESLRGDQTEAEIAHDLEHQIRLFGGDGCAFAPIVGVGPRAALPHAVKTGRRIDQSPFVLIDWGAKAGRYMSDLTRVLVTGKPPKKLKTIYDIVLEAQQRAIRKIAPGVTFAELDREARGYIESAGYGSRFGHGLGHGIGLQIHENPFLSAKSSQVLKPGMVLTIEPGIYLPGWGGVRIEDDLLVTRDGHEVLTSVPKSFEESLVELP